MRCPPEQAAAAGDVLIGAMTLVRDAHTEVVEPLVLKGKREPVQAFRALELLDAVPAFTSHRRAFRRARSRARDLLDTLAASVETRTPRLATIVGPPGIGKSRLARELLGRARARVVGRCRSYGERSRTGRSRKLQRRSVTFARLWRLRRTRSSWVPGSTPHSA